MEQVEQKAAELDVEEKGHVDKDVLDINVRKTDRCRTRVSKLSRMMESEQLRQARE